MSLLKLTNVTKRFGGLTAVDGVSLTIDSGEMVAIVGPNGAGKTTLFNTLSGVHLPDGGRIRFDGHDITRQPPHRRAGLGLGRTFQIPRPFGAASVRENIALGAMFGTKRGRASVEQAMHAAEQYAELLGLQEHLPKQASSLTPIENKRLGIARALAMRPKLLLLDEAMAGMNSGEIDEMIDVLRAILRGKTSPSSVWSNTSCGPSSAWPSA